MPRIDEEIRINLSVLDRLVDFEPEAKAEPPASRSKALRQVKQALRRDLEWLLNTRRVLEVPEDLPFVSDSILAYGLPDFTNLSVKNAEDQHDLTRALEATLKRFEPRLEDVVVSVASASVLERAFRFKIEARLRIDPVPEPISFDTTLQIGSGNFAVKGD
ncbi:MAG TPA: type VI secretion system baseplate subunit TssE [Thermoanaerobaculia bacterium]|nr:type VI secretion system baseplate subunit TssE [Thermoanaerobaculia bacterium]